MNFKNHILKFTSWAISIAFVLLCFPLNSEAKKAKNYDIDTYRSMWTGTKYVYQKNDNGKTLWSVVPCSRAKTNDTKIYSDATRVADNFSLHLDVGQSMEDSFFKTLWNNTKVFLGI